jgi:branched-chain amino acid transport system permease protein
MFDLFANAIVAGVLLGGLYAAVTVGLSITFGMLDVVNIAHPAFVLLGSFLAYWFNDRLGLDPILVGVMLAPAFFVLGVIVYRIYYEAFEKRSKESLRGLAFFFGILFVTEVGLIITFGVDYRLVRTDYLRTTYSVAGIGFPLRLVVPFLASLLMITALHLLLNRSFFGRAVKAVSQDALALRLVGANPRKIKEMGIALSIATTSIAGALLILVAPVQPSSARDFIGRVFAICVLGGMSSLPGTVIASFILGVAESLTSTFYGASWSPAVAFGFLLCVLAWRPAGLLGR